MTTLHLGVIDIPYNTVPTEYKKNARKSGTAGTETTGDVAEWLEDKYHVMEVFFELHEDKVAKALESSVEQALDMLYLGAPVENINPFNAASADIEKSFKHFLDSQEIETIGIPGVPTQAALDGVSHRFKDPRFVKKGKKLVKRPRRPSFIDTGLYEATMKAWVS
jgi:hypothetical protein